MLDNFLYSINVILPVFIIVVLGFVLGRTGFLKKSFTLPAEKLVFKLALPVMLFLEVAESDFDFSGSTQLIVFCIVSVTAVFLVVSLASALLIKNPERRGAFVQGACRSNFAVLGIPLAESMFGDAGGASIGIAMPFVIIMFNAYSVIILSLFSNKKKSSPAETFKKLCINIITNPLIIAVIIAVPFMLFDISLPVFAKKSLGYVSSLTTPLALICLGANFDPSGIKGRIGTASVAVALKLVFVPSVTVFAAVLIGLRGASLGTAFILFTSPSAVSSYIMAKNMENDSDLAAQILLLSTMLCIFTVFTGVFILKSFALI